MDRTLGVFDLARLVNFGETVVTAGGRASLRWRPRS